jgi:hypothetical protein
MSNIFAITVLIREEREIREEKYLKKYWPKFFHS